MIDNGSMLPGPVVPVLAYKDVAKAVDWLHGAFGFSERLRTPPEPDGKIHHLQLAIGEGSVILTGDPAARSGGFIESVMVPVRNIDEHFARAKQFGARILSPPDTKPFGERQYSAEDLEGHRWAFSESVADVPPATWGAIVSAPKHRYELIPRPRLCYLLIPAADVHQSAAFYERVFGWKIRGRDTDRPRFDSGTVSGAWVTGRAPSADAGLLPYIWVDSIDETLAQVTAQGGQIVAARRHDEPGGTSWIATFRDPAGNHIGLYQED
ncbi:MAG: VOC family protein [Bryobacteraceae bacterium]|jgi:predicted enzyme related to lactoylglutathione lyase